MKKTLLATLMVATLVFAYSSLVRAAGGYIGTGVGWSAHNFNLDRDLPDIDEQGGFAWEVFHGGYNFNDNLGISLVGGGVTGAGEFFNYDLDYTIGYLDLNFRYTYPVEKFSPYGEFGFGNYAFVGEVDGYDFVTVNANLGYRTALGAMVPIGKFYLAPELSYHWVNMGEFEVDSDEVAVDLGRTDFGLFLVKFGYAFGK